MHYHKVFWPLVVLVLVAGIGGCDLFGLGTDAEVRFQNSTEDFEIYHGLKFGEAEFLFEGSETFQPGNVTSYKATEEGTYSVQALDGYGNWQTLFDEPATVEAGGTYTLLGLGSTSSGIYGDIVVDEAP